MDDFERLAGLLGAQRSGEPPQIPVSREGLMAAFVAFGHAGTDIENQQVILKLTRAIQAYLRAAEGEPPSS